MTECLFTLPIISVLILVTLEDINGVIRKENQDIANYRHMETKLKLAGLSKKSTMADFDKPSSEQKKSLAICEHLRWNASHEMLGYVYDKTTSDLHKTHSCLKPWQNWQLIIKVVMMMFGTPLLTSNITAMKTNKCIPQPIDTSDIRLPEELNPLFEAMAKNVHEIWAQERISQGWKYGEKRDDVLKHYPCLVPYEDLPEEEKVYDRNTSLETLRLIIKLGFKIHL